MHRGLAFVRSNGIAFVALFVALGGTSYAVTSTSLVSSHGAISACVNKKTGALHLVASGSKCHGKRELVTWNQQGVAGVAGAAGSAGSAGATGATGAPATKLFAQIGNEGVVGQQSGSITASSQKTNEPVTGYSDQVVTFPRDLSACVATATDEASNGSTVTGGGVDDHVLSTSILGDTVTVYRPTPSSGSLPEYSVVVFC
jgi:hypothetical protein